MYEGGSRGGTREPVPGGYGKNYAVWMDYVAFTYGTSAATTYAILNSRMRNASQTVSMSLSQLARIRNHSSTTCVRKDVRTLIEGGVLDVVGEPKGTTPTVYKLFPNGDPRGVPLEHPREPGESC